MSGLILEPFGERLASSSPDATSAAHDAVSLIAVTPLITQVLACLVKCGVDVEHLKKKSVGQLASIAREHNVELRADPEALGLAGAARSVYGLRPHEFSQLIIRDSQR